MIVLMDLNEKGGKACPKKWLVAAAKKEQTENVSLSIFKAIKLTTFLQLAVDYRVAF